MLLVLMDSLDLKMWPIALPIYLKKGIFPMILKRFLLESSYESCQAHDDISDYFLSWTDKLSIVEKLKKGKVTAGFIKYEHILHGSPKLTFF